MPDQTEVVADIAWLLEAKLEETGAPLYLFRIVNGGHSILSSNIEDALRFSRKIDADKVKADLHGFNDLVATEHVWV